jgi:hypothetical protein
VTDLSPQAATSELAVDIRPPADEDIAFIRATWREGHRQSPGMQRLPHHAFKATRGKLIARLLDHRETHLLAAYVPSDDPRWPERVAGWIAWTPGRVPALHWVYVRAGENGYRERGLAALLFEQSGIGGRLVYTFIGAQRPEKMVRVHTADGTDRMLGRKWGGKPYSELLVEAGMRRGVACAHVDAIEWLEAMT